MSANRRRRSASAASSIAAETATAATAATAEAISTAPSKEQLSPPIAGGSASADEDLLEMPRICRCCCKRDLKLLGLFEASQPTLANTTVASASAAASVASNKSSGTLAKTCATEAETETPQTLSANPVNPGTKATSSPSEAATTLSTSTRPASASFSSTSFSTSTSPMRRRTTNTTAPSASPAPRGRSSDNAVDYTLSGAHSSMDIVLEEMTIWMLNINRDDGLPQEICRQCMAQFLMVAKFRRKCVRMQQRLQDFAQEISDRQTARQAKRQQKVQKKTHDRWLQLEPTSHEEQQPIRKRRMVSESDGDSTAAAAAAEAATATATTPAKQVRTDFESLPPPKPSPQQHRVRKYRTLSIDCEMERPAASINASSMPWKTKAARKELSENWASSCSTAVMSPNRQRSSTSSSEHMSDLSVGPCCGFESDSNPSSTSNSARRTVILVKQQSPEKTSPMYDLMPRRGRRPRKAPIYMPAKRQRRSLVRKEPLYRKAQPVNEENKKSDQKDIYPKESRMEGLAPSCDEAIDSTSDAPMEVASNVVQKKCDEICLNGLIDSRNQLGAMEMEPVNEMIASNGVDKELTLSVQNNKETTSEEQIFEATSVIKESVQPEQSAEDIQVRTEIESIANDIRAEADLVQSEELTSSTETSESQPKAVEQLESMGKQESYALPQNMEAHESVQQTQTVDESDSADQREIIVSIPLEVLDENLQRRLCVDPETEAANRQSADPKEFALRPDDVNNNENDENFCQSATADSFNSAVALRTNKIEATPPGGTDSDDTDTDEVPIVPSGPTPMDFMAEFAKHCANGIEQLKVTTPVPSPTPSDLVPLNDLEAKQKLEVEMNDVETTLNGILNEMQDQHMYTPNCAHIDEFLTPADYATLTEQESSVSSPPNPFEQSSVAEPKDEKPSATEDPFDNSNFTNELIGFQNDIPCFENIETPEEGQNLHLELTQFLRDLQPSQSDPPAGEQVEKIEMETQPSTVQMDVQSNLPVQAADTQPQNESANHSPFESPISSPQVQSQIELQMEPQIETQMQPQIETRMQHDVLSVQSPQNHQPQVQSHDQSQMQHQIPPQIEPQIEVQNQEQNTLQLVPQAQHQVVPHVQLQSQLVPHVQTQGTTTTVTYEQIYQQHIVQQTVQQSSNKMQVISLPSAGSETTRQWQTQQSQQQQQVQWSSVGGLEAIKSAPVESVAPTTTTYYISASDLYPQQTETYTMLQPASNESYVIEQVNHQQQHCQQQIQMSQQQHQRQHQQQQAQQQQQPIMILIQQPEIQQPVASASNPQQAPLHIYNAATSNDVHQMQHTQRQQIRQQYQHQQYQRLQQPQQTRVVQSHPVLGMPGATSISTKVTPIPVTAARGRPLTLKCRFCHNGPRFSSSLEYSRHIIDLHPAVAPFNCPHCPMAFAGRTKRSQHILSHHVVQQYQCGQCSHVFPAQKALDVHIQRFHMTLKTDPSGAVKVEDVQLQITSERRPRGRPYKPRLQLQQHQLQPQQKLQVQQHQQQQKALQQLPQAQHHQQQQQPQLQQEVLQQVQQLQVQVQPQQHQQHQQVLQVQQPQQQPLMQPQSPHPSSTSGHSHANEQFEELQTLQAPPTVLTPPSTIVSVPSPQPMVYSQHITMPSPEQSEPDSTTTLRQYRKRGVIVGPQGPLHLATPVASPSPSSSPSSSTVDHIPPASPATPASPAPPPSPAVASTVQVSELRTSHHCLYCEERFTNEISLKKHHQLAHGALTTMPYVCTICKRGYRMRTALHRHMESHDVEGRPYECNICRVRFPRPSQLTLHKITVHLLSKPHTCDECGKQFGTESALKTHIKFHGAHMKTHLPLGVFRNEDAASKSPSNNNSHASSDKLENPATPIEETPLTPMSSGGHLYHSPDEYPNSVESCAGNSVALESYATTP
uniref:Molting defective, isoform F n=1 Tax=Drosophila melanogaster TaxID=7227 RepID=A0A0B4K6J3_DROME|nr:molting defective, isoform F [Drosophila melanogaster]AFH06606.1 molting defective, isoform F [Drosophila melanogaster]|eukprot:NP_001247288.1 molting defective, isoform F [Drosophila melanogaster]